MKKISKILIITLLIMLCFMTFSKVFAIDNPNIFKPASPNKTDYDDFWGKAGTVLGFVRNLGAIISVLGIAVLGLRYMFGSLEQKANYKETMFPFIIGIAITLLITTLITIVQSVAETLNA